MKHDLLLGNLVRTVRDKLPQGTNLATELADILHLGKEAVYRRLRGEVPFSFEEAARIAQRFGLSLDQVVGESRSDAAIFYMYEIRFERPTESDFVHFTNSVIAFEQLGRDPNSQSATSSNTLPQTLTNRYDNLSKFLSFKWMYQHDAMHGMKHIRDMVVSQRMRDVEKEYSEKSELVANSIYIWDEFIFYSLVTDIKHFHRIGVIDADDVSNMKEELIDLITYLEGITITGKFPNGNNVYLYLSNTPLDNTYAYFESENLNFALIRIFTLSSVHSYDPDILDLFRGWFRAQRRQAQLITLTGEVTRVDFFRKQREIVGQL